MILYIIMILFLNHLSESFIYLRYAMLIFTLMNLVVGQFSSFKIAKSVPGPHMYPIIGSISLFAKSPGKINI